MEFCSDMISECSKVSDPIECAVKSSINVGDEFSGGWNEIYRTIGLDVLGIKSLDGGKQKKKAKELVAQYAEFLPVKPSGRALKCVVIFSQPRYLEKKRDGRGKSGIYIDRIIPLFVHFYMNENTDVVCRTSIARLARDLGIVSGKYKSITQEELLSINPKFTKYAVNQFYSRCQTKLNEIIFAALDQLVDDYRILEYQRTYRINTEFGSREGTKAEEKTIKDTEKRVLLEFNAENKSVILFTGKAEKYNKRVIELINEENGTEWIGYWTEIKLMFDADAWEDYVSKQPIRSKEEINELRDKLRSAFSEYIQNKTMKEYERNVENAESPEGKLKDAKYKLDHGLVTIPDDAKKMIACNMIPSEEEFVMRYYKPFKYNENYIETQDNLRRELIGDITQSDENLIEW